MVTDRTALLAVARAVPDPELPVLTLGDLGVIRDLRLADDGSVEVDLTPTYTGCPALAVIAGDVRDALHGSGADRVRVRTVLAPAWTTDWMSEAGRRKLLEYGIAPPGPAAHGISSLSWPRAAIFYGRMPASMRSTAIFARPRDLRPAGRAGRRSSGT